MGPSLRSWDSKKPTGLRSPLKNTQPPKHLRPQRSRPPFLRPSFDHSSAAAPPRLGRPTLRRRPFSAGPWDVVLAVGFQRAGTLDADPLAIEAPAFSRRRRKKSLVWEHFTVEAVAGGSTRACCKLCKQTFAYSSGSKIAGTSHLKRHITMGSCPKIREEKKQLALTSGTKSDDNASDPPAKRRYRTSALYLDQDRSCEDLAKMIAMLEYPLHTVEHPAFTAFIQEQQADANHIVGLRNNELPATTEAMDSDAPFAVADTNSIAPEVMDGDAPSAVADTNSTAPEGMESDAPSAVADTNSTEPAACDGSVSTTPATAADVSTAPPPPAAAAAAASTASPATPAAPATVATNNGTARP
ncbi:hypothetical protein Taro_015147, partial [Colocasia esculenta]|nr:hypothetical protein [Colocasia esculenta]